VEGKKETFPKFKRINCASHSPCAESLANHIKRANYVAKMWENANRTHSTCREMLKTTDGKSLATMNTTRPWLVFLAL